MDILIIGQVDMAVESWGLKGLLKLAVAYLGSRGNCRELPETAGKSAITISSAFCKNKKMFFYSKKDGRPN